ncbi:hypothetical protein DFH09DRAFT_1094687 [Mycena vulgaris]|nr:hypothetical protein DFH09DRAFT_1094687 [Mycena vulgaris]
MYWDSLALRVVEHQDIETTMELPDEFPFNLDMRAPARTSATGYSMPKLIQRFDRAPQLIAELRATSLIIFEVEELPAEIEQLNCAARIQRDLLCYEEHEIPWMNRMDGPVLSAFHLDYDYLHKSAREKLRKKLNY